MFCVMVQSQRSLADKFRNGAESGEASNLRIVNLDGGFTALVAFDYHVLALRTGNGKVWAYAGWYQEGNCKRSGSIALKNMFSRCNLWTADTIVAVDMSDDRRAIKGDKRASKLADMHESANNSTPTLESV